MKVIRVSAIWCPACLIMRPIMDSILSNYDFEQIEYDYDLDEDEIKKYNVGKILPVFIFMDGDNEVTRIIGEKKLQEVEKLLKDVIK